MEFCQPGQKYGFDFGASVTRTPCLANNVCHDFGGGQLGCVHAPLTKCDPSSFGSACDGDLTLVCTAPSSFVTEDYVIAVACAPSETCGATQYGPGCIKR